MNSYLQNIINWNFESWILLLILIILFIFMIFKLFKKWKIKIKKVKTPFFEADFNSNDATTTTESPHKNCPFSRDIVVILSKQSKILRKIFKIENNILRDLMNVVEDNVDNIIDVMRANFLSLLKSLRPTSCNLIHDSAYLIYNYALLQGKNNVMREFLRAVRENSFLTKEKNREWDSYKKIKAENIIGIVKKSLNDYYIYNDPTVETVYEFKSKLFFIPGAPHYLLNEIDNIFNTMLKRLYVYHDEIEKLHDANEQLILNLFK